MKIHKMSLLSLGLIVFHISAMRINHGPLKHQTGEVVVEDLLAKPVDEQVYSDRTFAYLCEKDDSKRVSQAHWFKQERISSLEKTRQAFFKDGVDTKDQKGFTHLQRAVNAGHLLSIQSLIKLKGNLYIQTTEYKHSLLHLAILAEKNCFEQECAEAKVDGKSESNNNKKPTTSKGYQSVIQYLVVYDYIHQSKLFNLKDHNHKDALAHARPEIQNLITTSRSAIMLSQQIRQQDH